ncbi:MAG: PDZ domain-containing protein, partial [Gemmataceae bacterium]
DVQWVLHNAKSQDKIPAQVQRGDKVVDLTLDLPAGWRHLDNISWRVSSWGLRRMATGGLLLEAVSDADRKQMNLAPDTMALKVLHVGQFGPHAAAKNAGFQKGDLIVSFDGKTSPMRETDLLVYALQSHKPGDKVPVTVLRSGKRVNLTLPMQE